jgi:hypothetical protein
MSATLLKSVGVLVVLLSLSLVELVHGLAPCNPVVSHRTTPVIFVASWPVLMVDAGSLSKSPKSYDLVVRVCNADSSSGGTLQSVAISKSPPINSLIGVTTASGSSQLLSYSTSEGSMGPSPVSPAVTCEMPFYTGKLTSNCLDTTFQLVLTPSLQAIDTTQALIATARYLPAVGAAMIVQTPITVAVKAAAISLNKIISFSGCTSTGGCTYRTRVGAPRFTIQPTYAILADERQYHVHVASDDTTNGMRRWAGSTADLQSASINSALWLNQCEWDQTTLACATPTLRSGASNYNGAAVVSPLAVGTYRYTATITDLDHKYVEYNADYASVPLDIVVEAANYPQAILQVVIGTTTYVSGTVYDLGVMATSAPQATITVQLSNVGIGSAALSHTPVATGTPFVCTTGGAACPVTLNLAAGSTLNLDYTYSPGKIASSDNTVITYAALVTVVDNAPFTLTLKATVNTPSTPLILEAFSGQSPLTSSSTACTPPAASITPYSCATSISASCVCVGVIESDESDPLTSVVQLINQTPSSTNDVTIAASGSFGVDCGVPVCSSKVSIGGLVSKYFRVTLPASSPTGSWLTGTVSVSATSGTFSIPVIGRVIQVSITPKVGTTTITSPYTFADQTVGTQSSPSNLDFYNTGSDPIVVTAVDFTSASSGRQFAIVGTISTPQTINAGAYMRVPVSFRPTSASSAVELKSDTLKLSYLTMSNSVPRSYSLGVQGNALSTNAELRNSSGARVDVYSTIRFDNSPYNTVTSQTFQFVNYGASSVQVSSYTPTSSTADFTVTPGTPLPTTLMPSTSVAFTISFKPTTALTRSATFTVTYTSLSVTNTYYLVGTTATCTADLSLSLSTTNASPLVPNTAELTVKVTQNSPFSGYALSPYVTMTFPSQMAFQVFGAPSCGTYSAMTQIWSLGSSCFMSGTLETLQFKAVSSATPDATPTVQATLCSNCNLKSTPTTKCTTSSLTYSPRYYLIKTPTVNERVYMYLPYTISWTLVNSRYTDSQVSIELLTASGTLVPAFAPKLATVPIVQSTYTWQQGPHRMLPGYYKFRLTMQPSGDVFYNSPVFQVVVASTRPVKS